MTTRAEVESEKVFNNKFLYRKIVEIIYYKKADA